MLLYRPIPILAPQRSPEWFTARRPCVTGSEVSKTFLTFTETMINAAIRKITGLSAVTAKYKATEEYQLFIDMDPFELFDLAQMEVPESEERKKYRRSIVANRIYPLPFEAPKFTTDAMRWGTLSEPAAVARYQMEKGILVKEAPFFLHQTIDTETGEINNLKCGASPDGLIEDRTRLEGQTEGVIEIKCLTPENHLYEVIDFGHVPEKYIPQIQMEMWITGRSFCDFIGFDSRAPEGLKVLIERIERDENYIQIELEPSIRRFLKEVERDERRFRAMIRTIEQPQQIKQLFI